MDNVTNISKFVGVLQEDSKCYLTDNNENYYLTHLLSKGASVPVAMSEYFFETYKGRRVYCLGFPRVSRKKLNGERKIFSYLSCIHVEETEEPKDLRYVEIEGQVASNSGVRLSKHNLSVIDFELNCCVKFDRVVKFQVPCRAFEETARKLLTLQRGDFIHVGGYIAGYDDNLRVIVKRVERGKKDEDIS